MFKRICPSCSREVSCSDKYKLKYANRDGSVCRSCAMKEIGNRLEIRTSRSRRMTGNKNPMKRLEVSIKTSNSLKKRLRGKFYTEWKKYKSDVRRITNRQPLHTLNNFGKRGLCGIIDAYQLDHKVSIYEGFKKQISAEIIGNIKNLRMIHWKENRCKGTRRLTREDMALPILRE